MSRLSFPRLITPRLLSSILVVVLLVSAGRLVLSPVYGSQLGARSLQLSSNLASATSTYHVSFTLVSSGILGSLRLQFCSNDPFPEDSCTAPAGLNISAASLHAQTGITDFSIASGTTANNIVLSRNATAVAAQPVSYTLEGATNPSAPGSYYVRVQTYASTDASGSSSDYGGIAFAIANSLSVTAEVPPYLIFCTGVSIPTYNCASSTGDYVDFGELTSRFASHGLSQMLAATNGKSGYTITIDGTTMTSGNNVVNPLNVSDVSRPGTSQFGINLTSNSSPSGGENPLGPGTGSPTAAYNKPNFYLFNSGDVVASYPQPDNIREYTVSYLVNVPSSQPPGVYVSTISYICLANF